METPLFELGVLFFGEEQVPHLLFVLWVSGITMLLGVIKPV
jgi:hypothetical protein